MVSSGSWKWVVMTLGFTTNPLGKGEKVGMPQCHSVCDQVHGNWKPIVMFCHEWLIGAEIKSAETVTADSSAMWLRTTMTYVLIKSVVTDEDGSTFVVLLLSLLSLLLLCVSSTASYSIWHPPRLCLLFP